MQWYRVNYKKLALRLLPAMLQRSYTLSGLLFAMVKPLAELQHEFLLFRDEKLNRLKYNGQVCYLQAMLNDMFDNKEGKRPIRVEDAKDPELAFLIFTREKAEENSAKTKLFSLRQSVEKEASKKKMLNLRGYSGISAFDFVVKLNMTIADATHFDEAIMRRRIDTFKLTSKRYSIEYLPS